jgi:hypothetical protein
MKPTAVKVVIFALALGLCACEEKEEKVTLQAGVPLTGITVTPEAVELAINGEQQLTVAKTPEYATGVTIVCTIKSSAGSVAGVSADGLITAMAPGAATVTVTALVEGVEPITKLVPVTVSLSAVDFNVAFADNIPLILGTAYATKQIEITTTQTDVTFTYASNNTGVATVDAAGRVTAVAPGVATIKVTGNSTPKTIPVTVVAINTDPGRTGWVATASSSRDYEPQRAIDEDKQSSWFSRFDADINSGAGAGLPQWIQVDMGSYKKITGFLLTNRRVGNACPKKTLFEVSIDGTNWKQILLALELPLLRQQQILPIDAEEVARYFRVTVESVHDDNFRYTYIADLNVYHGAPPAPNPGPEVDMNPAANAHEGLRLTATNQNQCTMNDMGDHDAITYLGGGNDPYVFSTPVTKNINSSLAYVKFEYKSNRAVSGCQLFVFYAGGQYWYTDLRYALTDEWTTMTIQIPEGIAQQLVAGSCLRFDLHPDEVQLLRVKNLEILYEPSATPPPPDDPPTPPTPEPAINMEKAIAWFYDRMNRGTCYNMNARYEVGDYIDLNGNGCVEGDCSSAVMYAVRWAGADDWGALTTDSMHAWLKAHGFQVISEGAGKVFTAQRGDIFIWGRVGQSGGAAGHTGVFVDGDNIIHMTYGCNGICVTNYNNTLYANDGDNTYEYLYRYVQ